MAQWPRIQAASWAAVACSVLRLVTAYTTSVVHFLLSSRRVLRMIWMAWLACGSTIPVATVTSVTQRCSTLPWARAVQMGAGGTSFPGRDFQLVEQAGLVALDGEQVVSPALEHQVVGVASLRVERVRGDEGLPEIVDALAQHREHWDFVSLARDVDLAEYHCSAVVDRGQQVPGPGGVTSRAAHCRAVQGNDPPLASGWFGAGGSPAAR
jgi:hypothetical protein